MTLLVNVFEEVVSLTILRHIVISKRVTVNAKM